jgi:non-heme chloroperoxidase
LDTAVEMAEMAKQANVSKSSNQSKGEHTMTTITTKDGTQIFYKDWGKGHGLSVASRQDHPYRLL